MLGVFLLWNGRHYAQMTWRISLFTFSNNAENGAGDHDVNNTLTFYDKGTGKSDSGDDEVEDDQKGDDDDMRHDGENEFSLGNDL